MGSAYRPRLSTDLRNHALLTWYDAANVGTYALPLSSLSITDRKGKYGCKLMPQQHKLMPQAGLWKEAATTEQADAATKKPSPPAAK